ncbi:MAG: Smr/MutS family protein [Muribaculaceae bacterium]|nr:Smr/MutS family protein [Muribaculaceae bacterium]
MIFPKDFETKVGFDSLRRLLMDKCETRLGKEEASAMSFVSEYKEITRRLSTVSEMVALFTSGLDMPEESVYDVVPWLTEIKAAGAFMSAERLDKLAATLRTMNSIGTFFSKKEESGVARYPFLSEEFSMLPVFPEIVREIERCIGKFGEVKDTASPGLADVRREMAAASGSMQRAMRRVLDRAVQAGLIDKDATPSLRDGRMVIPVSAASKRGISGIVHDQSATGKTVFIEPAEVVEAGNRLRQLEMDERREVTAVLISISNLIRPYIGEIIEGCHVLARLDFIKAKARFAIETGGEKPVIERKPEIDWYHALHPGLLLNLRQQGRTPVALDIHLDSKNRILIISGPNAGGKSVCLKTVAVVQYMMQCGMLPTLYSNSHMGIFSGIFIDIGDEQSIENDLSTYSSHLANMKFFLSHSDSSSLILADEMGSGTEPQIGGALAQAILTDLGKTGCMGVITTHYQNLKTFAEEEEGFINGAMLYDRQYLRPLFQLSIGNPGSSFALEIARNTGLPADVIERARELVGSDYVNMDKYLLDIQRDRRYWANKRLNIKEKEHKLDKLLETYESSSSDLKSQRAAIIRAAKEEAKEILAGANAAIERSIHEIRKAEAEKERTREIRRELEEYKRSVESDDEGKIPEVLKPLRHKSKKKEGVKDASKAVKNAGAKKELEAGDYVRMSSGGVVGKILAVYGKKAEVAFGALRTIVELSKLQAAQKPKPTLAETVVTVSHSTDNESRQRQLNFKNEIDVRGMRADEALQAVTYFLDDAVQFNASRLRILHGTGHGILKTLIRQQLKANPNVADFRDEDVRFGGAGITVIDMHR